MRRALAPVALGVLLLAAACGRDDPLVDPAAVGVRAGGCGLVDFTATGVAVGDDLVVTVAHTLAGADEVHVVHRGVDRPATVVAFDPDQDVAVVRVEGGGFATAALGTVGAGDDATLVTWNPDRGLAAETVEVTRRLRVTIEDIYVEGETVRRAFEVRARVEPGDSGGPVFNEAGEVAGIIYASSRARDGIAFALADTELRAALAAVEPAGVGTGRCL